MLEHVTTFEETKKNFMLCLGVKDDFNVNLKAVFMRFI